MGISPICNCEQNNDLENNKKVIKVNTEEEKYEKEEKDEKEEKEENDERKEEKTINQHLKKRLKTVDEVNQKKLVLTSEKHTRRNESFIDKSTVYSNEKKEQVSNSQRDNNMLNVKLRNKIVKKTHGRRSVFLNRTSVNIIIVGDKNVGKTSYAYKIKDNKFNEKYIPTKDDEDERFIIKAVNGERTYHLNVAIINNINAIKEETKRQLDYCLIFYDMNNESTMDFAKNIFETYFKSELENVSNISLSHVIFIGNKCDLNNNVNSKIEELCKEFKMDHFEISVKDNICLEEMKNKLTQAFDNDEFQNRK
jgi:GTPase SAR1 family protein